MLPLRENYTNFSRMRKHVVRVGLKIIESIGPRLKNKNSSVLKFQ